MAFHPDALVTRQVATNATTRTNEEETGALWRSSAAKYEQRRWAEQTEKALYQDAAFKRYQASIEKALSKFESVAEWADFISFLTRLLKALQSTTQFHAIPNKLVVAKRLSQCLNPALPSGVHTRALEVYTMIFTTIGVDGLRRDLQVWTPGLLPFFPHAATSVRPLVLDVYERFYLPLQFDLRPMTRALLLSLLSGLEEESSECFDRVVALLDNIAASVGWPFFLQTMWKVVVTSPNVRLCAFNFLARRMPKMEAANAPSLEAIDITLLGSALSHALSDSALLVRRQALDFLIQHMPLHARMFAQLPAKTQLFDAALGTVLGRDISLNRRLFTWLLGSEESDSAQQAYFSDHALPHVARMVIHAMRSKEQAQRACKIYVSLMDKRSIAQPLLRVSVLDVFDAFMSHVQVTRQHELYATAQMLFESLDEYLLYQALYRGIRAQVAQSCRGDSEEGNSSGGKNGDDPHSAKNVCEHGTESNATPTETLHIDAVRLCRYILTIFKPHEQETLHIHLPVMVMAIMRLVLDDTVQKRIPDDLAHALLEDVYEVVQLLDAHAFCQRTHALERLELDTSAEQWFSATPPEHVLTLQDASMCTAMIQALLQVALSESKRASQPHVAATCWAIMDVLVERLDAARENVPGMTPIELSASKWDEHLFSHVACASNFVDMHAALRAALRLSASDAILGTFAFAQRQYFQLTMDKLLPYLQPDTFQHHAEAVQTFWAAKSLCPDDNGSVYLCAQLCGSTPSARTRAMHAVGALWRAGGHATAELQAPVLLVLERLGSLDALERLQSQTWLRTYVHSFDALMLMLVDLLVEVPAIRVPALVSTAGRMILAYTYARPFDHAYINFYLQMLQCLMAGEQAGVVASVQQAKYAWRENVSADQSYGIPSGILMDFLKDYVFVLLRSSTGSDDHALTMSLCLDILRLLSRMEPHTNWQSDVESSLIDILLLCIDARNALGQVMLLDFLAHFLLHSSAPRTDDSRATYADLVRRGLLDTPDESVLVAWADFVQAIWPITKHSMHEFLLPLCSTVKDVLVQAVHTYPAPRARYLTPETSLPLVRVPVTEVEMNQLISVLESALTYAFESLEAHASSTKQRIEDTSSSFLGNISSVFQSESGLSSSTHPSSASVPSTWPSSVPMSASHNPMVRHAASVVQALEYAWLVSLESACLRETLACCTRTLERLCATRTGPTLNAIIDHWSRCVGASRDPSSVHELTIILLEKLAPSTQIVFTSVCEAITAKVPTQDRNKKGANTSSVTSIGYSSNSQSAGDWIAHESILFGFLDLYVSKLSIVEAAQVWPIVAMLAKSITTSVHKTVVFSTLDVVTQICLKLVNTRVFEEQRSRRDAQDLFVRLCELTLSLYARTLDPSSWTSASAGTGRDGDVPSIASDKDKDVSDSESTPTTSSPPIPALSASPPMVVQFFSSCVLPALMTLGIENDKVQSLSATLVYYVVAPGFRARQRLWEPEAPVLDLLKSLCRLPNTSKVWRTYVLDTFLDAKFFSQSLDMGKHWAPIVASLFDSERERLNTDVISRITTSSSNLFTSRESDLHARIMAIRRLSYVIYTCKTNACLVQLPLIQEKVVDILRSQPTDLVHAEVYLCMRVLLCRFASQHLSGFWPIILTEVLKILGQTKEDLPADRSDRLQLVFSVAKLADLLITLQTEDFQIHQWLLITDTPDAPKLSGHAMADSLLDCIANAVKNAGKNTTDFDANDLLERVRLRRPMLQNSQISSITSLEPFFLTASRAFYQNEFCGSLDWNNINSCLLLDLFEPIRIGV